MKRLSDGPPLKAYPQTIIAAVLRSVDEVAAKLRPDELAHVVNLRP